MKFPKIIALLGLTDVVMHSSLLSNKAPHARFTEEELEKLENALSESATERLAELENQLTEANARATAYEKLNSDIATAVVQAMETAGLPTQEGIEENLLLLATKCKEYGDAQNRHTFPENNGTDEPTNEYLHGYIDPNDEHNKFLNSIL